MLEEGETGENCIMQDFLVGTLQQILFGWYNQGKLDVRRMWHEWGRREMHRVSWGTLKERDYLKDLVVDE